MQRDDGLERIGVVVVGYGHTSLSDRVAEVLDCADDAVVVVNPRGPVAEVEPDRVRSVRMADNVGYAAAVNRGAAELARSCDLLLVLTHDAEIGVDDVAHLARTIGDDRRCAVVAPVIRVGEQFRVGGRYLGAGRVRHRVTAQPDRPTEVDWADGAVLLIRRDVFDDVGGFDPATFMYVEEVGFCLAVRDRGRTVLVDPGVVATQVPGAPARPRAHAYLVVRNHVLLARRRQGIVGGLRAAVAGAAFGTRSLVRALVGTEPDRRFHLLSALGGIDGAAAGVLGRGGPPPRRVARGTDVVLDG